jgi:predicted amidohydrolase
MAAGEGAELVLFPELSLTGYELDLADRLAFAQDDARFAPLIELATRLRVTLIVGAPVRTEGRLCIGALILTPDGRVDVYAKHHLGAFATSDNPGGAVPPPESTVFAAGDRNPLVRVGGGMAAIAVCADVGQAAHAKAAADRSARTYLASMFVIPKDLTKESDNLTTYARQHSMAVVFANFGGPSGGLPTAGRSAIWSEDGDLLVQLDDSGSGIAIATETDAGWRSKAIMLKEDG